MASEEDIYIESDGKVFYFDSQVSDGTDTITIPELSVIHRAMVKARTTGPHKVQVASGGISGNAIGITVTTTTSGAATQTSGLDISGDYIDIIAAGA